MTTVPGVCFLCFVIIMKYIVTNILKSVFASYLKIKVIKVTYFIQVYCQQYMYFGPEKLCVQTFLKLWCF